MFRYRRKLGRSEQYHQINSDHSRDESNTNKSQHHSLLVGGTRVLNSSHKRYRPEDHSEDKGRLISKGDSVSNSMSRMIRSSPKIHLKQHIHNKSSAHSVPKGSRFSSGFQNKLYLNRYTIDKESIDDSAKNLKLESILNRHVDPLISKEYNSDKISNSISKPVDTTASHSKSIFIYSHA